MDRPASLGTLTRFLVARVSPSPPPLAASPRRLPSPPLRRLVEGSVRRRTLGFFAMAPFLHSQGQA